MNTDIRKQLEEKIAQSNQRASSLTERLGQLDNFNQGVAVPQISGEGPKGYNPANSLSALMNVITSRKAAMGDLEGERTAGMNLLSMLANLQESEADRALEREKMSAGTGHDIKDVLEISKLAKDQGLVYDPETGQLVSGGLSEDKKQTIGLIDEILGRDVGAVAGIPNVFKFLTGENQYTRALIDQLKARLSVDQREKMKGSGQISDYESKLLERSVSALRYGMSNEDFVKELNKIRSVLTGEEAKEEGGDVNSLVDKYWK